jgi:UDP-N-acetylmuramate: L-alanyl-gamma-D-glutamyl-meso-diaminopimelate ligase
VVDDVDVLVSQVVAEVRPGDQLVIMSNGGFGGIHQKLLDQLQEALPV